MHVVSTNVIGQLPMQDETELYSLFNQIRMLKTMNKTMNDQLQHLRVAF